MKFKVSDILAVGILTTLMFPVVLFLVLYLTGTINVQLGVDDPTAKSLTEYLERMRPDQESADQKQSKLYQATQVAKEDAKKKAGEIQRELERLEQLKLENSQLKSELDGRKKEIEELVNKNEALRDQKIESLAQVYGSMKPVEAAPILLSLDNKKISEIVAKIPELRAQAKVLAALGAMDRERAAEISKLLGWNKENR